MQCTIFVILPTVSSLSLSLPPQILPGKQLLKQPEVNADLLHFSGLSFHKSSVETNFPIFAIASSL